MKIQGHSIFYDFYINQTWNSLVLLLCLINKTCMLNGGKHKLRNMARIQLPLATCAASIQPTIFPPKIQEPKTSPLTPFSAVAPHRFVAVSRVHFKITLETICEEGAEEECIEMSQNASSSIMSACFLEVQNPLSSYTHNLGCA